MSWSATLAEQSPRGRGRMTTEKFLESGAGRSPGGLENEPELRKDLDPFSETLVSLADAVDQSHGSILGFRETLVTISSISRPLRKATNRLIRILDRLYDADRPILDWRSRLLAINK